MIPLDKKTIYIIVAAIVVILIVGVAGVMLLNNGGNDDTNPTPTPAPTDVPSVADATSIQFAVIDSAAGVTYEYQCKNLNAADEMLRVDLDLGGEMGTYNYIIDMGTMQSWMSADGTTWTAGDFATDATDYATPFHAYLDKIIENGGTADFTYTTDAGDVTISCIVVNPTIDDSVFATS